MTNTNTFNTGRAHTASHTFITIEPVRTYATALNAMRAVDAKMLGVMDASGRKLFNVAIMPTADGRWYPLICNIAPDGMQVAISTGFNLVN